MEELDYWRLCDELSIKQAALLIVGVDPSAEEGAYCEDRKMHERPRGYEAAKAGISKALRRGAIQGRFLGMPDLDINGNQNGEIPGTVDIDASSVDVDSLRAWLLSRGIRTGFFFPVEPDAADYLDPKNPRYAPKLAAAVRAWQSVTDPGGKHPKQALEKWLRENAVDFGLTDDDGNPVTKAMDECSTVANWRPSGGAPKTPG